MRNSFQIALIICLVIHTAIRADPSHQTCPAWIEKYVTFHRQQRSAQNSAKYLVFRVEKILYGGQGGLGDRVRAMLFSTRLAVAASRVILFTWQQPAELTEFLKPASVDWRVNGTGYDESLSYPHYRWLVGQHWRPIDLLRRKPRDFVLENGISTLKDQFVVISTNEYADTKCGECPILESAWTTAASCLFKSLFRFHHKIEALALRTMSSLGLQQGFIGLHLRLGGLIGEPLLLEEENPNKVEKGGTLARFLAGISCARNVSMKHRSEDHLPVLAIVDNEKAKAFLRAGNIPGFVATDMTPVHLELAAPSIDTTPSDHYSTFAEVLMLSRADCLVLSKGSGFSFVAFLQQGGRCCRMLDQCRR